MGTGSIAEQEAIPDTRGRSGSKCHPRRLQERRPLSVPVKRMLLRSGMRYPVRVSN